MSAQNPRPDEEASIELGKRISDLIVKIARQRGITLMSLAAELGYSRAAFSMIIHSESLSRQWKLSTLCGVARVFGISVWELLEAAEADDGSLPRKIRIAEIQRRLEEIRITRLKCNNRLNAITMEEKRITNEMEKLKNEH